VIRIGVSLALAAALALVTAQCIDAIVLGLRVRALDSDTHRSVFGVISLLAQASAVLVVGVRCRSPGRRGPWMLLDALIAALLIVRALLSDQPAAFAGPVVAVFVLFWWLTIDDHRGARRVLRVGLGALALSFVIHIVGPPIVDGIGYRYGSWAYELIGISKHSTELAGWILVSTGALTGWLAARQPAPRRLRSALREGQSAA
jgi:hypothetical protein